MIYYNHNNIPYLYKHVHVYVRIQLPYEKKMLVYTVIQDDIHVHQYQCNILLHEDYLIIFSISLRHSIINLIVEPLFGWKHQVYYTVQIILLENSKAISMVWKGLKNISGKVSNLRTLTFQNKNCRKKV